MKSEILMFNYFRVPYYFYSMIKRAYWDYERLLEHQEKELRKVVKYAYDYVPFYHKKLKELRIKPGDIKTLKDLKKLPIIEKDEIRSNVEENISKEFNKNDLRMLSTSGSTGKPLHVFVSEQEDVIRKVKHLRANISCGQKLRDRWAAITSPSHFAEAPKLLRLLGIYAPTFVSVFYDTETQFSTIKRMEPDVLGGYASSLLLLAKEARKKGVEAIKPRLVFSGAELIDDVSRQFIEEVFDAPLFDQYAIVELERIAWQCPERRGYHVDADLIITQFVDENGDEVSTKESGQIVCTSLFNYAMPFIRYAVGDIGVPSDEKCPCGRTLPLMEVVEGRKDALLLLPDGRLMAPITMITMMYLFKLFGCIDQFRIIQKKTNLFEVRIKKKDNNVDERTIESELVAHIKRTLNIDAYDITFEIKFVDDIPLDETGKFTAIVSELKK